MTGPPCLVELSGLRVERGGVQVLDVPSFRVHDGEFVSLIGPNGSGKSSLLLALTCLLPRAAGEVRYRGRPVRSDVEAIAYRRDVAMVFQEPLLFDETVYDNVAAGLRIRGVSRKEIRPRVLQYLERFGLAGMAGRSARKLSGGEARRVNLARALVVEPELVLLDEPFANLDLPARQSIIEQLERALRDAGTAAVLVTHDASEALRLSDRMVVMRGGRIVQSGTPSGVMGRPADPFVASWVGIETILDGVVRRSSGAGEIVVSVDGAEIAAVGEGSPRDHVYCCIPPESVVLETTDPSATSSARNVFPGRIASVTPGGPFLKLRLDCGFSLVAHVTHDSFAALKLAEGKDVFASFKATAIHVFRRGDVGSPRALSS